MLKESYQEEFMSAMQNVGKTTFILGFTNPLMYLLLLTYYTAFYLNPLSGQRMTEEM